MLLDTRLSECKCTPKIWFHGLPATDCELHRVSLPGANGINKAVNIATMPHAPIPPYRAKRLPSWISGTCSGMLSIEYPGPFHACWLCQDDVAKLKLLQLWSPQELIYAGAPWHPHHTEMFRIVCQLRLGRVARLPRLFRHQNDGPEGCLMPAALSG